jgi:trans-2-enoyl-CoA reductase
MAASLLVNPFTAYRMLEDFVPLKDGDVVVQNSANSAVGQAVIQLASMRNIKTINVIRNRPHFEKVSNYLMELGGSIVISEEQAITHKAAADIISEYGMPSLALNGVGGKSVNTLLRYLSENGTLVTYGGMSRKPITIPTGSLIFKGYTFVGYWNSRWLKSNLRSEKHLSMIQELSNLAMSGNLKPPPFVEYKLSDYKAVLQRALQPYSDTKMMFSLL